GSNVSVKCGDGSIYETRKVIVTVPLPIYKQLEFIPSLPEKIRATEQIGFGSVVKILIRFTHKWWAGIREQKFERLFFLFSDEKIPTWWTQYPEDRPVLTGWLEGPKAAALAEKSETELVETALQSLANIFSISIDELKGSVVIA